MPIVQLLSQGSPRSLGEANTVVKMVLNKTALLDELYACMKSDDAIIRMRAIDALEKVCRHNPELITPYIDDILTRLSGIDQPSVQWHVAQMIGELDFTRTQQATAIHILKKYLEDSTDWIVLNYSLQSFDKFARQDTALQAYFVQQLKRLSKSGLRSVAKRSASLLAKYESIETP